MPVDVVSLAVKVDSRDLKKANLTLVDFGKQAEKTEKKTDKSFEKLEKAMKSMEAQFKKSTMSYEKNSNKMQDSTEKNAKSMLTLKKAVLSLAGAFGVYKAAAFTKDAALAATRYETLGVVLNTVGLNAGRTSEELNKTTKALEDSGISMASARQGAIKLIQAHINLSNSTKLSRIAQDAAVIGNINSSKAFERLIHGIQTAQTEVLKTIGITVNFENAYKKLAATLGISAANLTENQKTQARLNIVMERGADIAGAYEAAMETSSKKINSFARHVDNFKVKMGEAFGPAISLLIDKATESMKGLTDTMSSPEAQEGMKEFALGLSSIASALMDIGEASATVVKFAGLKGVSGTFAKGLELSKAGFIDKDEFISAGFMERQKMVDEAIKKSNQDLWISKKKFEERYKKSVDRQVKAEENSAKRIKKLQEEAAEQRNKLADKQAKKDAERLAKRLKDQRETAAKILEEAEIEYFKLTQGQLALDKNLVRNQAELWVQNGFDRVKANEWANAQIKKLDDEAASNRKKANEKAAKETVSIYQNMSDILENSLSNLFADALRGDLDSFEDYFSNFTNSLSSMWAQMAAKMIISQQTLPGVSPGSFTAAGAGIAAMSLVSAEINKQNEKDAERFKKLEASYVQANQLTGSLLGDLNAKSESTNRALDNILETNIAGLEVSRGMLNALRSVQTNNERLAAGIGRSSSGITRGGPQDVNQGITTPLMDDIIDAQVKFWFKGLDKVLGTKLGSSIGRLFGSTKQTLIDQGIQVYSQNMTDIMERSFSGATFQTVKTTSRRLFRRRSSTSTQFGGLSSEVSTGLAEMFMGVSEALEFGADTFGITMDNLYSRLTIAEQQISLKGKTAAEAAEIIGNFVSQTADNWAQTILSGTNLLNQYQQAGEGAFETYVRLTNETEFFSSSLEAMGFGVNAVGVEMVNVAQGTIDAAGGIESLNASMSSFYNAFFTDAEKQQNLLSGLQETFSNMGLIMPATRQGFRNLVEGLDLTNEADQERFARLMEMSKSADQFYNSMDDVSNAFKNAKNSMINEMSKEANYDQVRKSLMDALTLARTGDLSTAMAISGQLGALSNAQIRTTSEIEYKRERGRTLGALAELEALTGSQLTTDEMILSNIEEQVSQLQNANDTLLNISSSLSGTPIVNNQPTIDTENDETYMSNAAIVAAIEKLQEQILNIGLETIKYGKKSYDIIDKWDGQGYVPTQEVV